MEEDEEAAAYLAAVAEAKAAQQQLNASEFAAAGEAARASLEG